MLSKSLKFFSCFVIAVPSIAYAAKLPTQDEIDGVLKLCSFGNVKSIEGNVKGKIEFWKKGIEGTGKGSVSDLGGLLATVPAGDINPEVQKNYNDCVINTIKQFIGGDDVVACKPSDELISRLDQAEKRVIDIDNQLAPLYGKQDELQAKIDAMPNGCEGNVGSQVNLFACVGSNEIKMEHKSVSRKISRLENEKRVAQNEVSRLQGKLCG